MLETVCHMAAVGRVMLLAVNDLLMSYFTTVFPFQ